jgi:hypothetical protein
VCVSCVVCHVVCVVCARGAYVQLPPVVREGDENKAFAFNAESWPLIIDAVVQLNEVFRQKDVRFVPCRVVSLVVSSACVVFRTRMSF